MGTEKNENKIKEGQYILYGENLFTLTSFVIKKLNFLLKVFFDMFVFSFYYF